MTSSTTSAVRTGSTWEAPLLGLFAGWTATVAWSGMITNPARFLVPLLLVGLAVVLVGTVLRRVAGPEVSPSYFAPVEVLVGLLGLNAVVASSESWLGVVPTRGSLSEVAFAVVNGGATLNYYQAPVSVNNDDTRALLLACGLGVLLSIQLLISSLQRPALVALPLLVALSVPISILRDSLALPVFVGTALLFIRLLGTERPTPLPGRGPDGTSRVAPVLWQVGILSIVVALLAAPVVPVLDLLDRGRGGSAGSGGGGGSFEYTSVNPFINLRRDLVEQTHTPMVYARTKAPRTSYLRTTVLDEFNRSGWEASTRHLPADNDADGRFPPPPGLGPTVTVREYKWRFELAPDFLTTWLPLPYPLRSVDVPGTWRYDDRTLDVALVGSGATSGVRYSATTFTPEVTARTLNRTLSPPSGIQEPNIEVPVELPDVIGRRAREVTKGATTDFERAVALQDWFRDKGDFRYSLEQRPGSGMQLLADFVTDDRVGYCEQFAAAMAAMGRALGIPSRVVVGFLDGSAQADGRMLYTSDDRHAWPEMYFSGVGWVRFEPTPGQRAGATPPWTRQDTRQPEPTRAPEPRSAPAPVPADRSADRTGRDAGFQVPWRPAVGVLLVGVVLAVPSSVRRLQRRRRLAGHDRTELSEGAWAELRATATDLGLGWPEQRSPREQARSVTRQVRADREQLRALEDLLVEVEEGRYGPPLPGTMTLDPESRARTRATVAAWRKVFEEGGRRTWRSRLFPASWWPGR